jgi:HemY protein
MIRLVLFLIVIAALGFAGTWLADNPGFLVLTWQGWEVRTSVAVALVLLLVLVVALVVLVEVLRWLKGVPRRVSASLARSRQERGYRELTLGLLSAAAGDPAQARGHHKRAERLLGNSPGTLLLAAQSAQLEGKEEVAGLKFQQMLKAPETEFLGIRGLLAQAMKKGDMEEALSLARRARHSRPDTPWVLTTLFDLQARTGRWQEALQTVADMARAGLIDKPEKLRRQAVLNHMAAGRLRERGDQGGALGLARKAARLAPGFPPAAIQAAELARESGQPRRARKLLEQAWYVQPHPALARAYGELEPGESAQARLERFDRLWDLQPNHPETQLVLAELCLQAGRFDEARRYLDKAAESRPTARVFRLHAEVERAAGGDAARINEWLGRAMEAEADPAWVCEVTGVVLPRWSAFGPGGDFDSVRWTTPPRIATMISDESPRVLIGDGGDREPGRDEPGPAAETTSHTVDATAAHR